MSQPPNKPSSAAVSDTEPKPDLSPVPILLIGLFSLLVYWGMVYLDNHGGNFDARVYPPYGSLAELTDSQPVEHVDPQIVIGKKVFVACSACHQANAMGVAGQFPPLAGSDWVAKSPDVVIRIVLNGLQGPISVNGQAYNNAMLAWKGIYSDEEIAAVISYVRGNKAWNNNASLVTADQVKAVRAKIASRDAQFSSDELLKLPEAK